MVSHELRTPLAAMLGWVGVLKTGATGDRAARALDTIERSGRAQAKLIEDLLDASRMITGKLRLDLRLADLPNVLRQAIDVVRPTAEAKGIQLQSHLDPSAGPVVGDIDRLQQIVWNLLSNAVKFTPARGSIRIALERFRQAESAEVRRTGGLGLGLAIVRHLVEMHGGSVAAASEGEGRGATFTVTMPLAPGIVDAEGEAHARR